MVVYDISGLIGGLIVGSLCVGLVARVQGKAGLL